MLMSSYSQFLSFFFRVSRIFPFLFFFFFNDTATTEIYTLSLHDALPISIANLFSKEIATIYGVGFTAVLFVLFTVSERDRKSTRLNSSHGYISYAVFCLKKKKHIPRDHRHVLHSHHSRVAHRAARNPAVD